MTTAHVGVRLVESEEDKVVAKQIAAEYGDWAISQARAEYGIVLDNNRPAGVSVELAGFQDPRARLYLAEVRTDPAGIGGLKSLSADVAEIKRLYVRPAFRGHGIGRLLLQTLLDEALVLEYRTVKLESAAFMRQAHKLYRSFGFQETSSYQGREFEEVRAVDDISIFMEIHIARN
jgi:GNAT superfamily N-acetyltransferase